MNTPELPHNLEAERVTLGSCLLNRDAVMSVATYLLPEHFYFERHTQIFAAALDLFSRREPVDIKTLFFELKARGHADGAGGLTYLSELMDGVPTSYHVDYYARRVVEAAERRKGMQAGARIVSLFCDETVPVEDAQAKAQTLLTQATTRARGEEVKGGAAVMDEVWDDLSRDEEPAITTDFYELDDMLGGFYPGEFIILGARPSVGKSSFALSLLYNIAGRRAPAHVLFFSLEMKRLVVGQRLAAMVAGLDLRALRQRRVSEDERRRAADAAGQIAGWTYAVSDTSEQTPASLRAHVMRYVAEHPRTVVVVDYLQLMGSGKRTSNRQEEVSEISRQMKILAGDANVPLLALSQLSRKSEDRPDQRPILSDLRESGSLEQDADVVMLMHRPGVEQADGTRGRATETQLLIEKSRNGPIGVVNLQFQPETTRFVTPDKFRTAEGY